MLPLLSLTKMLSGADVFETLDCQRNEACECGLRDPDVFPLAVGRPLKGRTLRPPATQDVAGSHPSFYAKTIPAVICCAGRNMEHRALRLSFIASYILLMLSFHTGASGDALILSLGLAAKFTLPARAVLALFFVGASGWALVSLARRSSFRTILPVLALTLTQFLWFLLPAVIELVSGREIPQTRYSSGLLAVLHSTQYLWITSYYQKKEARAAGDSQWSFSRYLLTLIAGGIALFIPGPWIVSRVFHTDFAASFLTFAALVNIHHFILDGAIWKLRDSRVAALLLDGQQKTSDADTQKQNSIAVAARWLTGRAPGARAIRIATVALLFVWAGVDQLHFWWSSEANALPALERAAALNPNDSSVQVRLARAEQLAGQRGAALVAMQRASALNPANLALEEFYGRSLIEAGRDTDAYAHFQKIIARWPRNADALVHLADLQEKQADIRGAAESYQHALHLDAELSDARSTASDWFNYAQFLRKQKQPERYVFGCLLQAENTLESTPSDELRVVSQARKESEARLGKESFAVRSKLDGIVRESLNLQVSAQPAKK
jgi:tetratricopeptide (TPR) repeat protein